MSPNNYLEKKEKTKKSQGLGARPKGLHALGHRRAGASASPARTRATSWPLAAKAGRGRSQHRTQGAASQDLAEPRAASFDLATADEHRRRERKHCQVVREKTLSSTPVSTPSFSHTYQSLGIHGTSLNPIQRVAFFFKEEENFSLRLVTKLFSVFLEIRKKTKIKITRFSEQAQFQGHGQSHLSQGRWMDWGWGAQSDEAAAAWRPGPDNTLVLNGLNILGLIKPNWISKWPFFAMEGMHFMLWKQVASLFPWPGGKIDQ